MENPAFQQRLSRITTLWSVVCRAHDGSGEAAVSAQRQLLDRYGGAVRRYLQAVVRTSEAADELFQEFAVRLRETIEEATARLIAEGEQELAALVPRFRSS